MVWGVMTLNVQFTLSLPLQRWRTTGMQANLVSLNSHDSPIAQRDNNEENTSKRLLQSRDSFCDHQVAGKWTSSGRATDWGTKWVGRTGRHEQTYHNHITQHNITLLHFSSLPMPKYCEEIPTLSYPPSPLPAPPLTLTGYSFIVDISILSNKKCFLKNSQQNGYRNEELCHKQMKQQLS